MFVIDRRPLKVILLRHAIRYAFLLLIIAAFITMLRFPPPEGMAHLGNPIAAYRSLCVFFLCVVLWASNLLPLAITSLMAIALIALLGVMPGNTAYSLLGNKVVFFILGAFILGAAITSSGLSGRLSFHALKRFGHSPRALFRTIFLFSAALSLIMSEHVVAAFMFPIVLEIARILKLRRLRQNYGKLLFFAMSWGCITGGAGTFLGGGRAPLMLGILEESTGSSIGFFEYILFALPLTLGLGLFGWFLLPKFFPVDIQDVKAAEQSISKKMIGLGMMTLREKMISLVMFLTVCAYIFRGEIWGLANISIFGVAVLFLLKLVSWEEIQKGVNWGIILMYGGAIAVGAALVKTGAANYISSIFIERWISSAWGLIFVFSLLSAILTECLSNSAVVAVLLPVGLSLCPTHGLDPRVMAMAVVLPSNFAFMFPMATPATAIAYSSGYFHPWESARAGFFMNLFGLILFWLMAFFYWPWLGLGTG